MDPKEGTRETMLDGFETLDEPAPQETPAPAQAPAQDPASNGGNAADPWNQLNETLRPLGHYEVKSPQDVAAIVAAAQKGMREAQEANAQAQARLRQFEPLVKNLPPAGFSPQPNSAMYQDPQEFGEQVPRQTYIDPVALDVLEIKDKLAQREVREAMQNLASKHEYSGFLNNDIQRDVLLECVASGNYDAESVFLKKYGPQLIKHAQRVAVEQVAKKIQANNTAGAGLGTPTPGGAPPTVDPLRLPPSQQDQWLESEIHRIDTEPGYADRIVAEMNQRQGIG